MKNTIRYLSYSVLIVLTASVIFTVFRLWDRYPGYTVDLLIQPENKVHTPQLKVGFSARSITPVLADTWIDADNDAAYNPKNGDTFEDRNDNGVFDAVWMAGFGNGRAANGIHDSLWARAMVIDDGQTRLAMVVLDAIGFGHDDVVAVRKRISQSSGIDYAIVISTHTHESPDLVGLWGASPYSSGVNPDYMELVKRQAALAIDQATSRLQNTHIRIAQNLSKATFLVEDSRQPTVLDPGIRLVLFLNEKRDSTLGIIYSWANHPETLWSKNLLLTSDFPHYVRQYMEDTYGGTCLYVNGAIGGLMTTSPDMSISAPLADTMYRAPGFDKAEAQGYYLHQLGVHALDSMSEELTPAPIALRAKTLDLFLANNLYKLAAVLGVLNRGMTGFMKIRTEVAYWTLGEAGFLHIPGEIYPEIVNGGVESPEGNDFDISPVESPPLRELMPVKYKFVVGLSNDLIGYIVPKSQWDAKAPYTYGQKERPYGEVNSVGPETAPKIYSVCTDIIKQLAN